MPTAKDLLALKKSLEVVTVPPAASVRDACRLMRDRRIGSVLVAEGETIHGIFTERDVVNLVVAGEKDPALTAVADVMTRKVIAVQSDRSLAEIEAIMRQERVAPRPGGGREDREPDRPDLVGRDDARASRAPRGRGRRHARDREGPDAGGPAHAGHGRPREHGGVGKAVAGAV